MTSSYPPPLDSTIFEKINEMKKTLNSVLIGKENVIEQALSIFFAGGHLLLEGAPGTGKTTLAKTMSSLIRGKYSRIQMTSDLLPSDLIGFLRLNPSNNELQFREGPVFSNLLIADELNRTSPKTQGALLEAMEERSVTVDGTTHKLPEPFFVIATENPIESHGVYPLIESQLDRFMALLSFDAPSESEEFQIYSNKIYSNNMLKNISLSPVMSIKDVAEIQQKSSEVFIEENLIRYALTIIRKTREITNIAHGVSVRGGGQFLEACKALAFLRGRNFITPKEIQALAVPCLSHRLVFKESEISQIEKNNLILEILLKTPFKD